MAAAMSRCRARSRTKIRPIRQSSTLYRHGHPHTYALAASSEDKSQVNELLSKVYQLCDKAAGKGIIHKNTAARRKSRLTKAVAKLVK